MPNASTLRDVFASFNFTAVAHFTIVIYSCNFQPLRNEPAWFENTVMSHTTIVNLKNKSSCLGAASSVIIIAIGSDISIKSLKRKT